MTQGPPHHNRPRWNPARPPGCPRGRTGRLRHATTASRGDPGPAATPTYIVTQAGMTGWQIVLIAIGAALAAVALTITSSTSGSAPASTPQPGDSDRT